MINARKVSIIEAIFRIESMEFNDEYGNRVKNILREGYPFQIADER